MIRRRTFLLSEGYIQSTDGTKFPYSRQREPEWNFASQTRRNVDIIIVTDPRTDPPTTHRVGDMLGAMNWASEQINGTQRTNEIVD